MRTQIVTFTSIRTTTSVLVDIIRQRNSKIHQRLQKEKGGNHHNEDIAARDARCTKELG